jgi:hypothetical protein
MPERELKQYNVSVYIDTFQTRNKRLDAYSVEDAIKLAESLPSVMYATAVWECKWRKKTIPQQGKAGH